MISRIPAVMAAALILGSASVASATTAKSHAGQHYLNHNSVMLLEDAGAGRGPNAAVDAYAEEHNYIEKQNTWK
jgi:hypothetical protein